jgi:F-type H+-transporting ATPase subunit epsilon
MLHLRILTTEKTVFDGTADEITLPTEAGMIGVLAQHSPLITIIKSGQMKVKKEGEILEYIISGGILEVRPGSQVVILATEIKS